MKPRKQKKTVLNAEDKFSQPRKPSVSLSDNTSFESMPIDLAQLGEIAIQLLSRKNIEVSKVRPFFWSMVETYVDRFQQYPFDTSKALFNCLELTNFPEQDIQKLIKQLEVQFEKTHGRPLRKSTQLLSKKESLAEELKDLRDSLKYAAMVAECDE